jgi:hypothetical protein
MKLALGVADYLAKLVGQYIVVNAANGTMLHKR